MLSVSYMCRCSPFGGMRRWPAVLCTRSSRIAPRVRQPLQAKKTRTDSTLDHITKVVQKLPENAQGPILTAVLALIREKDAQLSEKDAKLSEKDGRITELTNVIFASKDKIFQLKSLLIAAMQSAGVKDGRSFLEWVEQSTGIKRAHRANGWKKLLESRPNLLKCLKEAVPSWMTGVEPQDEAKVLGSRIAQLFMELNNNVHSFTPRLGLIITTGVPNMATSEALKCIAQEFQVPFQVQDKLIQEVVQELGLTVQQELDQNVDHEIEKK